jgi:hypothetical protein
LYVASFFGRHQIVRLLLHRGADKYVVHDRHSQALPICRLQNYMYSWWRFRRDLLCEGVRAIDVAGFASADPVDRMKVRSLLQGSGSIWETLCSLALFGKLRPTLLVVRGAGEARPQVILRLDDRHSMKTPAAGDAHRFRLEIHFSEAVDEFTQDDVVTSEGCTVSVFSMLRADLYVATVQLSRGTGSAYVEVPAGAARAVVGGRCSARSKPLTLSAGASSPQ